MGVPVKDHRESALKLEAANAPLDRGLRIVCPSSRTTRRQWREKIPVLGGTLALGLYSIARAP
jgi:hypothetical protein